MDDNMRFSIILSFLPENTSLAVKRCLEFGNAINEIRLRKFKPVALTVKGKPFFLFKDGGIHQNHSGALICGEAELKSTFLKLCDNSVFAHTKEIEEGYISVKGGFRAGICGDFPIGGNISKVSSINIRIPSEVVGSADKLFSAFSGGMLICGPPGCGKTTVLRDLIRSLSCGGKRISVIDSRREISGGTGEFGFDLGPNTDVVFSSDKPKGTEMALRTMFPHIIALDEIGTIFEVTRVLEAFNSGVGIIVTAHAGSLSEIKNRSVTKVLIKSGAVKTVALLPQIPGGEPKILDCEEICFENYL